MVTFIIGTIFGLFLMNKFNKAAGKVFRFKLLGFQVTIEGPEAAADLPAKEVPTQEKQQVVNFEKPKKKKEAQPVKSSCAFCNDTDIYVGGDHKKGSIMPCPKCGRNKEKVKVDIG